VPFSFKIGDLVSEESKSELADVEYEIANIISFASDDKFFEVVSLDQERRVWYGYADNQKLEITFDQLTAILFQEDPKSLRMTNSWCLINNPVLLIFQKKKPNLDKEMQRKLANKYKGIDFDDVPFENEEERERFEKDKKMAQDLQDEVDHEDKMGNSYLKRKNVEHDIDIGE